MSSEGTVTSIKEFRALKSNSSDHIEELKVTPPNMIEGVVSKVLKYIEEIILTFLNASEKLVITSLMCLESYFESLQFRVRDFREKWKVIQGKTTTSLEECEETLEHSGSWSLCSGKDLGLARIKCKGVEKVCHGEGKGVDWSFIPWQGTGSLRKM
jgi:hypothetical protein